MALFSEGRRVATSLVQDGPFREMREAADRARRARPRKSDTSVRDAQQVFVFDFCPTASRIAQCEAARTAAGIEEGSADENCVAFNRQVFVSVETFGEWVNRLRNIRNCPEGKEYMIELANMHREGGMLIVYMFGEWMSAMSNVAKMSGEP